MIQYVYIDKKSSPQNVFKLCGLYAAFRLNPLKITFICIERYRKRVPQNVE